MTMWLHEGGQMKTSSSRSLPKAEATHTSFPAVYVTHSRSCHYFYLMTPYWVVQWSWFARVNALCNLSRKKSWEVSASLPGQFLSKRCFTLCVTMEVEPRIAKQYKCQHCCSCKNYCGKGMDGGKKSVFVSFSGWLEDREFMEKMRFGAS